MKKISILLYLLILGVTASAAPRENIFSRLRANTRTAKSATVDVKKLKSDSIYASVSDLYRSGRLTADGVIDQALYHKVWSTEAAERCLQLVSSPRATMELGVLYAFSPEFAGKSAEGVKLLESASKAGYREADEYLGFYYFGKKDYNRAKKYFEAAAPLKNGFANTALGSIYLEGYGDTSENGAKARENYREGALKGYPRAMTIYGMLLTTENGGTVDYPEAFFWEYIAGDLGEDYARLKLNLPRTGQKLGTEETAESIADGLRWIEAARSGKNFKNDPLYKEGFLGGLKAYERAAEQGDDWARYYLGSMNYNDDFLNRNYAQVLRYYLPVSKNGKLPKALLAVVNRRLAEMYRDGKGVAPDAAKAAFYEQLAAKNGSVSAYKIVEGIY